MRSPIMRHHTQRPAAVEQAKEYISGALAAMLDLGSGSGPMDHGFAIHNAFTNEKEV